MNINNYGAVFVTPEELFEYLYAGKLSSFENVFVTDEKEIVKFNGAVKETFSNLEKLKVYQLPEESLEFFDEANQCTWFMPEGYASNLVDTLYSMCETESQRARVDEELTLFIQHGMFDMLFYLKYLVDTMRENNIVWGVGRGSSVASYVLFLIGVHKIDSIKYKLDITEFLRN